MSQLTIESNLVMAESLLKEGPTKITPAYEIIRDLIIEAPESEIELFRDRIFEIVEKFDKNTKKYKELERLLEKKHSKSGGNDNPSTYLSASSNRVAGPTAMLGQWFTEQLRDIEDNNIFIWVRYTYLIGELIERTIKEIGSPGIREPALLRQFESPFQSHVTRIFQKGYAHCVSARGLSRSHAISKSVSGFRNLIDALIQAHADQLYTTSAPHRLGFCRSLTSALITAAYLGVRETKELGDDFSATLRLDIHSWGGSVAYLGHDDLKRVAFVFDSTETYIADPPSPKPSAQGLFPGQLRTLLDTVSKALDDLTGGEWPLAIAAVNVRFPIRQQTVIYTLHLEGKEQEFRPIEIGGVFNLDPVRRRSLLQEFLTQQISAAVWVNDPANPGNLQAPDRNLLNDDRVVIGDGSANAINRLKTIIERLLISRRGQLIDTSKPLTYNPSRAFPLHQPKLIPFWKVSRPRIRELGLELSTRLGVMTLCSVRRSGKTMASDDIKGPQGDVTVVTQTCETTNPIPQTSLLFKRVKTCIAEGKAVENDLVASVLDQASDLESSSSRRTVLIIDEYERLFGSLSAVGIERPRIKFEVALPLIDQLVAYSRENLLVLLGQRPDAYNIFMDLNQLSPYVRQRGFPLFELDEYSIVERSEFFTLVRKAISDKLDVDPSFVRALHNETSGHPYLTVNILNEFFDWIIEKKITLRGHIPTDYLREFLQLEVPKRSFFASDSFSFFNTAASEALMATSCKETSWLHYCYRSLDYLHKFGDHNGELPIEDLKDLLDVNVGREAGVVSFTFEDFCRSSTLANFLDIEGEVVRPKIRLLSRIAASQARN
jgi:hypothetical protein